MINSSKWKEHELEMLSSGMTDEEVMKVTGRTLKAVQNKRYEVTGHYRHDYEPSYKNIPKDVMLGACRSDEAKEARIIILAKRIGVKIKGVR